MGGSSASVYFLMMLKSVAIPYGTVLIHTFENTSSRAKISNYGHLMYICFRVREWYGTAVAAGLLIIPYIYVHISIIIAYPNSILQPYLRSLFNGKNI